MALVVGIWSLLGRLVQGMLPRNILKISASNGCIWHILGVSLASRKCEHIVV